MTNTHKVTVTHEISQQFIDDMIVTATEGGINYWCSAWTQTGNTITVVEEDDFGTNVHYTSVSLLVEAIQKAMEGKPRFLGDATRKDIIAGVTEDDAGIIDADAADAIVQIAVFGEVTYG